MVDKLCIRFVRGEGSNRRHEKAKSGAKSIISTMNVIKQKGGHKRAMMACNLVSMLSTFEMRKRRSQEDPVHVNAAIHAMGAFMWTNTLGSKSKQTSKQSRYPGRPYDL